VLPNKEVGWQRFKKHLLMLKEANIPLHVLYCWYPSQIKLFPEYFRWFDAHNIRVGARRYVGQIGGFNLPFFRRKFMSKFYPKDYNKVEWNYLYVSTCPKVTKYGLKLEQPKGKSCTAGKDMILVRYNGDVALCADTENQIYGNIFNKNFKLSTELAVCPSKICGGDYGMLHLIDDEFGPLPKHLIDDNFFSQIEEIKQGSPISYPNRMEMLKCLSQIEKQ
jgi:MoaA/NifB/PqqE/SkfB family radical SAM enzyme